MQLACYLVLQYGILLFIEIFACIAMPREYTRVHVYTYLVHVFTGTRVPLYRYLFNTYSSLGSESMLLFFIDIHGDATPVPVHR